MTTTALPTFNPDDLFEPEDGAVRRHLGLRPHAYPTHDQKGSHPDQRPCPSWCWITDESHQYDHEIEATDPMCALHSMSETPKVVASHYTGRDCEDYVQPATIEAHMTQRGQEAPQIEVYLRHYKVQNGAWAQRFEKKLRLSLTDAEELATVLQYIVKRAEAGSTS